MEKLMRRDVPYLSVEPGRSPGSIKVTLIFNGRVGAMVVPEEQQFTQGPAKALCLAVKKLEQLIGVEL